MKRFSILAVGLLALSISAFAQNPQIPTRGQGRRQGAGHSGAKLKKLDTNQDGSISRDEWAGKAKRFDRIDANNDGRITTDEATAARGKHGKRALKEMDANNDRQISRSEWTGNPEAFGKLDANNDGVITKEELKARHHKKERQ